VRGLLEKIGDRLKGFVEQRDDVALVLSSPASDALPILTLLEDLEAASASDLFWIFTDAFKDPCSYADAVAKAFATKHEAVRLALEKAGMTPWPSIPPRGFSPDLSPAQRLRGFAAFSRELLPVAGGGNLVWVFFPLEIGDHKEFAGLIEKVLQHTFPNPWCHHLRFIIREDPSDKTLRSILKGLPRLQWYQPDLGPEAVQRSLEEEVADECLSIAERLGNVMVLAGIDHANRRYPEALEKYELLLQYHAPVGNHAMAAVALNGMGEAHEKMGNLERAGRSYQAALISANRGNHPPVPILLNVVLNLANLRLKQERWDEAEAYFDMTQKLATIARNGPAKVQALDFRGVCQYRQRKLLEAERSWYDGSVLAAQLEDVDLCRTLVWRLQQYYAETRQFEKERERRDQLAALGR
jgi:tetratricopeptide (TPR) repeat protein